MLPYSPLHHLLMKRCPFPLIATSGNRSDEPIAIGNDEATTRLKDIADHFLMHNRPIVRACDDSVVRLTRGRAGILRRARGYAPLGIRVAREPSTRARCRRTSEEHGRDRAWGATSFSASTSAIWKRWKPAKPSKKPIADLCRLYSFKPEAVVCDLHPDYASTHWAESSGLPVIRCSTIRPMLRLAPPRTMSRARISESPGMAPAMVSMARSGVEILPRRRWRYERVAHLRPFGLPGGDAAVREGWRSAASLLFEVEKASGSQEWRDGHPQL